MKYYWFIFCKTDLLLEKVGNNYTIPLSEEPPIALRPWTHVMNIRSNGGWYRGKGFHD